MQVRDDPETPDDFGIDRETLAFIVLKARAYDVLVAPSDPDEGSNAIDDGFTDTLEDGRGNPAARELHTAIAELDADAKVSLIALAWLGRGDFETWTEARAASHDREETPAARYLMGIPLLGDFLEGGADIIGLSLAEEEVDGLSDPDIDTRGSA